jgi:ferredoxin--NADP+ reductase
MPHVVTQPCCADASCVFACPVNCIHPTPDEPDFATAEMLYVDPAACVDCGACVSACPVDAIVPEAALAPGQQRFVQLNADFYRTPREHPALAPVRPAPTARRDLRPLRVAIVGSGPAAMYAADELVLTRPGVRVDIYERLPVPYGLVAHGVAPDHVRTKEVASLFDLVTAEEGVRLHLGVEVGRDVTHEELMAGHDAVIYAVGASSDRKLAVPGASLAVSATDFVAWYNGHPEHAFDTYDLSHPRVVVVGTGNVALDVARILAVPAEALDGTEISPIALDVLKNSAVEEILLLARRGPAHSAFTVPEFAGLLETPDVSVELDGELPAYAARDFAVEQKLRLLRELPVHRGGRRIVLRYDAAPVRIVPGGIEVAGRPAVLDAGLVVAAIGYRGRPVPGLPFDDASGTVPHGRGRVRPGVYVTGWIKRGPTGFIGTNKSCAQETVASLVEDYNAGLLTT